MRRPTESKNAKWKRDQKEEEEKSTAQHGQQ
jgi:hypothetical protein